MNDASLSYDPETSIALGFGFRCGFLGLLHLEIIQERLEREYNLDLVTTAPGLIYKVFKTDGTVVELTNPSNLPDPSEIDYMEEPVVEAEIMVTTEFIGSIMELCQERRGKYISMDYIEGTRALLNRSDNPSQPIFSTDNLNNTITEGTDSDTELPTINSQNVSKFRKGKLDAYMNLLALLETDVTEEFLLEFRKLFIKVIQPYAPLWFIEDSNN